MPNPMSRREEIARIVDHEGFWERLDNLNAVIKSGICSDDQHMELCHVRDEEIAGTEESLTKADAILSLPSEHEGLVGDLMEALRDLVDQDLEYRGHQIVIECGAHSEAIGRVARGRSALARADQALTPRGGDEEAG